MKAVELKCPGCGARVTRRGAESQCAYCGANLVIAGAPSADGPAEDAAPFGGKAPGTWRGEPSVDRRSGGGPTVARMALAALILVALVAGIIASQDAGHEKEVGELTLRGTRPRSTSPAPAAGAPAQAPAAPAVILRWSSDVPIIRDAATGERQWLIGSFGRSGGGACVAALDVATGKIAWSSGVLPDSEGTPKSTVFDAGDLLLVSTGYGRLTALDPRDGGELWRVTLHDQISRVERDPGAAQGEVLVRTVDKVRSRVALDSGAILGRFEGSDGGVDGSLERLPRNRDPNERHHTFASMTLAQGLRDSIPRLEGFDENFVLFARDQSFHMLLGEKEPGTDVPMLVRFEGSSGNEIWRNTVPAERPLEARLVPGMQPNFHADGEVCAVVFGERSKGPYDLRLAAFSMGDGRRLWDEPLEGTRPLSSVTVQGEFVYVVRWSGLEARDKSSGDLRYRIAEIDE